MSPATNEIGKYVEVQMCIRDRVYPAYIERENVAWCDRERYFKSGRYCERELCDNWEIELYRVCRNYEELIERLGGERSENNNLSLIHIFNRYDPTVSCYNSNTINYFKINYEGKNLPVYENT